MYQQSVITTKKMYVHKIKITTSHKLKKKISILAENILETTTNMNYESRII